MVIFAIGIVAGGAVVGRHLSLGAPSVDRSSTVDAKPTPVRLPAPPPVSVPDAPIAGDSGRFAAEFEAFSADLNADVGIVVHPVGSGPPPVAAGEWSTGPAWSTIKVPLVIAGLRAADSPEVTESMRAAITRSDNVAAETIWESLGDPVTAAQKVQDVLAEAGDPTIVESQKVRPEFTAFGQTEWSLADQATFLSFAACDVRNQPVLSLMSQVEPSQSWGLAAISGAQYKGGWGPSEAGAYLVRQMGIIPLPGGSAVITVAAAPNSGTLDDGTVVLTRIADWLSEHTDLLPAGACP
ncbi:hypothetical protein AU186_15715 [Mycobacterium sp. GA-1999]|nr:hypothetical protein AU185_16025 [Mycobacterium sp. GA-0227b]KUH83784.1 hypothetical protein AU186_15715 [Mycobacterium sp. GA-1999]